MPYDSGDSRRDQGISKAGNHRARELAIELAWLWVRHQPDNDLTLWFHKRGGDIKGRIRRIAIVAGARKGMVALWRALGNGVVATGGVLAPSPGTGATHGWPQDKRQTRERPPPSAQPTRLCRRGP